MKEVWKDVPGYCWGYQASDLGRIRSTNYIGSRKTKVMKPRKNRWGYLEVTLWVEDKPKTVSVHKMVANTFLQKPDWAEVINHKNGNKSDNRVENLEWSTYKANAWHSVNILHKNVKPIKCVETDKRYWSAAEAGRDMELDSSHISAVAKGKRKSTGGYTFEYLRK